MIFKHKLIKGGEQVDYYMRSPSYESQLDKSQTI